MTEKQVEEAANRVKAWLIQTTTDRFVGLDFKLVKSFAIQAEQDMELQVPLLLAESLRLLKNMHESLVLEHEGRGTIDKCALNNEIVAYLQRVADIFKRHQESQS